MIQNEMYGTYGSEPVVLAFHGEIKYMKSMFARYDLILLNYIYTKIYENKMFYLFFSPATSLTAWCKAEM